MFAYRPPDQSLSVAYADLMFSQWWQLFKLPAWRIFLEVQALIILLVLLTFVVTHQPPPVTKVISVATVRSSGCGVFGNLTCHFVGTTDNQVIEITDDSWVLMTPDHCYRITERDSSNVAGSAIAAPCP